jgi:hypothetical protein
VRFRKSAGLGLEIQKALSSVDRYNRWIYERFELCARKRILDADCAIGNGASHLTAAIRALARRRHWQALVAAAGAKDHQII